MPLNIENILNLEKTIASKLFSQKVPLWHVLPQISHFITELGSKLDPTKFDKISENIWIAKTAQICKTASLNGPLIVDENAEIRHCAYIRGNVIVGKNAVVGNSTEIKKSILFDAVQVPHYNYIGDSILGYKAHMGAGSITSNIKSDKSLVCVTIDDERIPTNLRKFGAIVGDYVEIGCNCVLNPGTIIEKNSSIYPLNSVRGFVATNSIYKSSSTIVTKQKAT